MTARSWPCLFAALALLTAAIGCPSFGGDDDDDDTLPGDDDTHQDDDAMDDDAEDEDLDGDGYTVGEGDCDDEDPGVNPGVPEFCYDALDNDCDGDVDLDDQDGCAPNADEIVIEGDGASLVVPPGAIHGDPGLALGTVALAVAPPTGVTFVSDRFAVTPYTVSFAVPAELELPCDAAEGDALLMMRLDDEDDDSWEEVPSGRFDFDTVRRPIGDAGVFGVGIVVPDMDWDGDGYVQDDGDCDEFDATIHPGAPELDNGVDDDCDAMVDEDFVSAGDIIVTEFLDYPIQVESADEEWLELYNTTASDIDLAGWRIFESYRGDYFEVGESLVVPAGGYVLLATSADSVSNGNLPPVDHEFQWIDTFGLWPTGPQRKLQVMIVDDAFWLIVDEVPFLEFEPWPMSTGRSAYLDPGALDADLNDDPFQWCQDDSNDYGGGPGSFGTPGGQNPFGVCCLDADGDGHSRCDGDCDDADDGVHPFAVEQHDGVDDDCDGLVDEDFLAPGDVLITEYLAEPLAALWYEGQWFEVFNTTAGDINLRGWELRDALNSGSHIVVGDLVVPAGGFALLAISAWTPSNGNLPPVDYEWMAWKFHLHHPDQEIALLAGAQLIDAVAFQAAPPWPIEPGYAVYLDPTRFDVDLNDDPISWCANDLDDYGGGPGDYGTPGAPNPAGICCPDDDGDGFTTCEGDCDDADDGMGPLDQDGDGYSTCDGDCDDADVLLTPEDADGDGLSSCDGDCDDGDAQTYPGAPEQCDGADNSCDGVADEGTDVDDDGDGWTECAGDCDDAESAVCPDPYVCTEICDGLDNDCNPATDENVDHDGDGYAACDGDCDDHDPQGGGLDPADADGDGVSTCDGDCDDADPTVFPGNPELCDGLDNDCDPTTDENVDGDGDGYSACQQDCDDTDPTVCLSAFGECPELCDGLDNDCDGTIADETEDNDLDGFTPCDGDCDDWDAALTPADADGDGQSSCDGDCDDTDATVYAGAPEACDGVDTDCDPSTDENVDGDGDGYSACEQDCDDTDPTVCLSPYDECPELCDGLDNNCNGTIADETQDADGDGYSICDGDCDDWDAALTPVDADGDGYSPCDGDCEDADPAVYPGHDDADGDGWGVCGGDCDDGAYGINPGATEICDTVDNDCDGDVDEGPVCLCTCTDGDADSHYPDSCTDPNCPASDDCDDADPTAFPGNLEACDGVDNDCDGAVDEDGDGDGADACADCDDGDPAVFPGATEDHDLVDNDCDVLVDEDFLAYGDVLITEFMDSSEQVADEQGEWLELVNTTGFAIDLVGWVLRDDSYGNSITIDTSVVVPAGGTALLASDGDPAVNGGLPPVDFVFDHGQFALASSEFGYTHDEIILEAGALELDRVEYLNAAPWPEGAGYAAYLDPTRHDADANDDSYAWCLDDFNDYGGGPGDFGTPGAANPAGVCCIDADGDGVGHCDGDCNDADAGNYPGNVETCDGADNDCDGGVDEDGDGDGAGVCADCDDGDPTAYPGAPEDRDLVDNDCDGLVDEDFLAPGDIVVTEYMDDPWNALSDFGEWFEVYNASAYDVDLIGWVLSDDSYGDSTVIDASVVVPAGGHALLAASDDPLDNGNLPPLDYEYYRPHFMLFSSTHGYTHDEIVLTADGLEIDRVAYRNEPPWPDGAGYAAYLDPTRYDAAANDEGAVWCLDDFDDYGGHPGDYGTPGAPNPAGVCCVDDDGDGVDTCEGDCDDTDPDNFPGNPEVCDSQDNDCDGIPDEDDVCLCTCTDADLDGHYPTSCTDANCQDTDDCDDADPDNFPGNPEACDGADNDCSGAPGGDEVDVDGDGYMVCDGDCDDADGDVHPNATEACNGIDDDCAGGPGADEADADGDGTMVCEGDCDDGNAAVYPGATEVCNGIDDDCDNAVDDDDPGVTGQPTWFHDADGDGYTDVQDTQVACDDPDGVGSQWVASATADDCDDGDADVHPGATETTCDGVDQDCDGLADDDPNVDGDPVSSCDGDCNDNDATIYPGATETTCDGVDQDCDGLADDDPNADGDPVSSCNGDCDDNDPDNYPGNQEDCDGQDNDCSGAPDADEVDGDGDGYMICDNDCNDADPDINPGAAETCANGIDEDCDGTPDDGCSVATHCGTITSNEFWAAADLHHITCPVIVQHSSAPVLTIEDGATVVFDAGTYLAVAWNNHGLLDVQGAGSGVTFTSAAPVPAAGDWAGLVLGQYSDGSTLTGATVAYAGGTGAYGVDAGLYAYHTDVALDGCAVTHSATDGLHSDNSIVSFQGGQLGGDADLGPDGGNGGSGLVASGSTLTVVDTRIDHNGDDGLRAANSILVTTDSVARSNAGDGVELDADCDLDPAAVESFARNTITGNGSYPIVLPAGAAGDLDAASTLQPNGLDRIRVLDGTITRGGTWVNHGVPWFVDGDVLLQHSSDPAVVIADGNELRFAADRSFTVAWSNHGLLEVQGGGSGVIFTSDEPVPAEGDWAGLILGQYSDESTLTGATVAYAGGAGPYGVDAGIYLYHTDVDLDGCEVRDSAADGLFSQTSTVDFASGILGADADLGPVGGNGGSGLVASGSTLTVADTRMDHNGDDGLRAANSILVLTDSFARNNGGDGVDLDAASDLDPSATPSFASNVLTGNGGYPIVLPAGAAGDMDAGSVMTHADHPNGIDRIHVLEGTITRDGTWRNYGIPDIDVPWFVDGDVLLQHSSDPTVVIADGNELRFAADRSFTVAWNNHGLLDVQGGGTGVVFTSDEPVPAEGDWAGLILGQYSDESTLTGATIEYAGGTGPYGVDAAVYAYHTDVDLDDCEVVLSAAAGVYCQSSTVELTGTVLGGHLDDNLGSGLAAVGSTVTVADTTLDRNGDGGNGGDGLTASNSILTLTDLAVRDNDGDGVEMDVDCDLDPAAMESFARNTITGNGGYPIVLPAGAAGDLDAASTLQPNGLDRIRVLDGTITRDGTWVNHTVPWFVDGDVLLQHSSDPTVVIADGNELRFAAGRSFTVAWNNHGLLDVQGGGTGVTFTSAEPAPAAGDWGGLILGQYADGSSITGTTILYGGGGTDGNLVLYHVATGWITDTTLDYSQTWGLYRDNSTPTLTNVTCGTNNNGLGCIY